MGEKLRIWIIIGLALIIIGTVIFVVVMSIVGWDFKKFGTKLETKETIVTESFSDIKIVGSTADIIILQSTDEKVLVSSYEREKLGYEVKVSDGKLLIEEKDERGLLDHVGISFSSPKLTIYLPNSEYGDLEVKQSTGKVKIDQEIIFNNVKIEVSTGLVNLSKIKCKEDLYINVTTGETKLNDIECKNLFTKGSTGDLEMERVFAIETFDIERDTGDVEFEDCDANSVYIKTSTGDVEGSFRTNKIIFAKSNTGEVEVPRLLEGGSCEIFTSTGDIEIYIKK